MIAFSQPVRLGDYISVDGEYGTVEEIASSTRTSARRRPPRRHPQRGFASKAVNNYSMGSPGSMVDRELRGAADVDVESVRAAVLEVGGSSRARARRQAGTASTSPDLGAGGVHSCGCTPGRPTRCGGASSPATCAPRSSRRIVRDGLLGAGMPASEERARGGSRLAEASQAPAERGVEAPAGAGRSSRPSAAASSSSPWPSPPRPSSASRACPSAGASRREPRSSPGRSGTSSTPGPTGTASGTSRSPPAATPTATAAPPSSRCSPCCCATSACSSAATW